MGRDNQSRVRQARKLARKVGSRASADRVLIVTEGSKTEPHYFDEIRKTLKLPTANISVFHSEYGTCPLNIVRYAIDLFNNGCQKNRVAAKAFEKVFVVFDRDEHQKYFQALELAKSYEKRLRNDQKSQVELTAIVSIPSFELWLLLHFEDVRNPIDRVEALNRLKGHLPDYEKGSVNTYSLTSPYYDLAKNRAEILAQANTPWTAPELFSNVYTLVDLLVEMKR